MLLIESQYLPPIYVFYVILQQKHVDICLETHEVFQKPLHRNRTHILTADGIQALSIPLQGGRDHRKILHNTHIDNTQQWQRKHWHALLSAYNNAPYFEHYKHIFEPIYQEKYVHLLDFNTKLLHTCLDILKMKMRIQHTQNYQKNDAQATDLRNVCKPNVYVKYPESYQNFEYLQVFADRQPFMHNLSIIDLIMNEGKYARDLLQNLT
jgi:hypothetical protein